MAENSSIEWTDSTWNPIRARRRDGGKVGWHCEPVSPGCALCYAERINGRLGTGLPYKPGHLNQGDVQVYLDEATLLKPLSWKKPRRIFVGSMTDLFGRFVTDEMLDRIFAVMALAPRHSFQVLTKRPERMRAYFEARGDGDPWAEAADAIADLRGTKEHPAVLEPRDIPLPNVWLGVSAEDQQRADERIPHLLATPAAVRFLSAEPLVGPIDLRRIVLGQAEATFYEHPSIKQAVFTINALKGVESFKWRGLDWVIAGGMSGQGAPATHPDWPRSLRDQCAAAGVPFFFKQWGEFAPFRITEEQWRKPLPQHQGEMLVRRVYGGVEVMRRLGKKAAGRLLDGVLHDAMPGVRPC